MIANARMYAVTPAVGALWRRLLDGIAARAGMDVEVIEHAPPAPIADLWRRPDKAAVFMCGLPYGLADPRPVLVAAPVPSPSAYGDRPIYWSSLVVRADSRFRTVEDTFGERLALTTPDSQSGYAAALRYFAKFARTGPLYREVVAPVITPRGALMAVISGAAEVAPIDSYALDLLARHATELTAQVRVIARTVQTPIPPLVASHGEVAPLAAAFLAAHEDAALRPIMADLLLTRFVRPEAADYDPLPGRLAAARAHWRRRPLAVTMHPAFA
ncbi:MAG: phosphate/phosphite/phosphonate ABC transporter substrate-binding protein [Stellaceae bacterium]